MKITEETIEYIRNNMDFKTPTELHRELGIDVTSVYRIFRKIGKPPTPPTKQEQEVIRLYPNHSNAEIATMTGSKRNFVEWVRSKFCLRKALEYALSVKKMQAAALNRGTRTRSSDGAKKTNRMRKMDSVRVLSGEKPLYNFRQRKIPRRTYMSMYRLIRLHNYFGEPSEDLILGYDKDTKRSNREEYYTKKYGIEFIQAEE